MWRSAGNIFRLGVKELYSLRYDPVLVFLIVYAFTLGIYEVARGSKTEVERASVAIVDEDRSLLTQRLWSVFLPPEFQPPQPLAHHNIDRAMDNGSYTFVIDIPPDFQADVLAGRHPTVQLNVDATAMTQAGNGARYIQHILQREIATFLDERGIQTDRPVDLVVRAKFNPNLESAWFLAVMEIVNNLTLLAIVLTGAAVIREREHGTIEHLLVMPLRPFEIMVAKVWANGLVIVLAALLSLIIIVQHILQIQIRGSIPFFVVGAVIYMFSVTALGIFLASLARSMPQFGLLAIPVFLVMILLSGSTTPLDAMPAFLQTVMQISPSTHFVSFSQAVLFRDADLTIVWPQCLAMALIGCVLFILTLARFRATMSATRS
ncbi:MAG: ABC transporter permease [Alphaproteobacteria bacterium]|nr:ABC transporter permease [Alphaproteobacteria bacterium]